MSGGHFNYDQYKITEIAEDIQSVINKNKKSIEKRDRWGESDDREYHYDYPDEITEKFKEAVYHLKIAAVYAQRIDYLLSGDDGEENFLRRLREELSVIKK
jgi:hypothetical protein